MNNKRRKKTKSEIAVLAGSAALFLGLIVMLVGLLVAGDNDDMKSLATMFVGMGIFAGSTVTICVASVMVRRDKRKQTEHLKAALPENAVLLNESTTAYFTDEGLRIIRDNTFMDFAPAIPYSEIAVYYRCFRRTSRAKGKENIFLQLPRMGGDFFDEEEDEGGNVYIVGEEVLSLAQRYGVKIVDTRRPPVKKLTFKRKFTHRYPGQRKMALRWTIVSIAAFAAVLGVSIVLALNTDISSGVAGGIAAGVVTPCVLTAARNWKKNVLKVYEEGILFSMFGGQHFLFWEEILKIEVRQEGFYFDCGAVGVSFPEIEGAVEYLREIHPEKFEETV